MYQLKYLRVGNELTQQQVADVLGVSRSTYCSYETGRRTPDVQAFIKLSKFYRVPLDEILGNRKSEFFEDGDGASDAASKMYLSELSKRERNLVASFRALSIDEKAEVMEMVAKLKK